MPATATTIRKGNLAWIKEHWPVITGLCVASILLLILPLSKPIWTDEYQNMAEATHSYGQILTGQASRTQPPLHLLLIRILTDLFGSQLAITRIASSIPVVVAAWYAYLLGRRISPRVGVLALWLTALSPGLTLFGRMARYHGLLTLFATMSVYYALTILKDGKARHVAAYVASTFLMLMTYYFSLFVIIAQAAMLVLRWRHEPHAKRLAKGMGFALILFLPWLLPPLLHGPLSDSRPVEDAAISLGTNGFVRRAALPVYVFCVGETVYMWNWPVVIAGLGAFAGATWLACKALRGRREFLILLTCVLVVLLSAVVTSGSIGTSQTLGSMGKRVSFVLPLFYVAVSAGLVLIRRTTLQVGLLAVILGISLYSQRNYWLNREFMNPVYVARWDEAISEMKRIHLKPDTAVISYAEVCLNYYVRQSGVPVASELASAPGAMLKAIEKRPERFVWIVGRDRGDRRSVQDSRKLASELSKRYKVIGHFGVMPRSPEEIYWTRVILRRSAAPYYIWGDLYDKGSAPGIAGKPLSIAERNGL
jgi:hypothetical protein